MSAYKTRKTYLASGATVTEIDKPDGSELTGVWVIAGLVYWEDPDAGTVQQGTPLEFHEWMVLKTKGWNL
jgi:hypothetical protein